MPELKELSKTERTEICRSIARAAHDCLAKTEDADGCIQGGAFHARLYKACSELGVIEDAEFTGNSFSKERIEALKEFEQTYQTALELGSQYDDALVPMGDVAKGFAMSSASLVRMYCVSRFSAALHKEDSPFANLRVCTTMCEDDVDGSGDENDENNPSESESEDEGEGEEDDEDIVATTSDDSGDSDSSDSDSAEFDDDDGTADDAEICAQASTSEEELGERACKKARHPKKKGSDKENDEIQEIKDTDEAFAEADSDGD